MKYYGDIYGKPQVILVTVSSRRYKNLLEEGEYKDESGDLAETLLERAGYKSVKRVLIKDDPKMIRDIIDMAVKEGVDIVIFIGGTGVAKDDVTVETIKKFFDKELPGFNILYTLYSEREIGVRAQASRATAGFYKDILLYAIPGSPAAVKLCIEKLILPEAEHLLKIRRGFKH